MTQYYFFIIVKYFLNNLCSFRRCWTNLLQTEANEGPDVVVRLVGRAPVLMMDKLALTVATGLLVVVAQHLRTTMVVVVTSGITTQL